MEVWRIGTNWDGIDLFPIFKKHLIAFAGQEVAGTLVNVLNGDIVAISKGQKIIALGIADNFKSIADVDLEYAETFDDVNVIQLKELYLLEEFPDIDFGHYWGVGKQFHKAGPDYSKIFKTLYYLIQQDIMNNQYVTLLKAHKNLVLTGAPGTGKTYLAKELAKEIIFTNEVKSNFDNKAFDDFRSMNFDQQSIEDLNIAWAYWKQKILNDELTLEDFANTKNRIDDDNYIKHGGYLPNFLERTSKKIYGSSKPGSAERYGIKMNQDGSYFIMGLEEGVYGHEKAEAVFEKEILPWLKDLLKSDLNTMAEIVEKGHSLIRAKQLMRKIVVLEHPEKVLSIYQDEAISNAYKYFINGVETNFLKQNITILEYLYAKFQLKPSLKNQLKIRHFLWRYFNSKSNENIDDITNHTRESYLSSYSDFVQFHPSYDYTDFFDGLRPVRKIGEDQLFFELKNGTFKTFCLNAKNAWIEDLEKPNDQKRNFVFIIDEINRAEISKVFGELFYAIDPGYRGEKGKIRTQYGNLQTENTCFLDANDDYFYVPENVYIIGTMNDIDRSVDSFDFAMRRRFCWREVSAVDRIGMWNGNIDAWKIMAENKMNSINAAIDNIDDLGPSYHIGPAYFLKLQETKGDFVELWNNHIGVVIKEYLRGLPSAIEVFNSLKNAYDTP